jgi:iron complex outermembrane receptor protein
LNYFAEYLPNAAAPGGQTATLVVGGGNPNLKPETAKVFAAGADWQPDWDPNLNLSVTYTHVDFANVIGLPPVTNIFAIFTDPALAPYVDTSPDPAFVAAAFGSSGFQGDSTGLGPAGIQAIFNEQDSNLASEIESKIDLRASYLLPTSAGQFLFSTTVDRFLVNNLKTAAAAPTFSLLDTFGEPTRWKLRGGVGWSYSSFSAGVNVNYLNSYSDNLVTPRTKIDSWTTADLYFGYTFDADSGALQNTRLALTAQNVTNAKPPHVQFNTLLPGQAPIPFDPVNASPVGRLVAVQVTKDF